MAIESAKVVSKYSWRAFSASGALRGDDLAQFVGVERGFALHLILRLPPDQVGKGLREARVLGEGVSDIDVELKGDREAVIHQAGGDKDTLRIAQRKIAVADSAIAEQHIVAIGNQGLVAVGDGERNKVECLAGEDSSNRLRNSSDHALQLVGRKVDLAAGSITNAIGSLLHRGDP